MPVPLEPFEFVDVTGTSRRLRALVAIGHPVDELAGLMGIIPEHTMLLLDGVTPVVPAVFRARAAAAYDRLWNRPMPGSAGDEARSLARLRGWVVPLAWDHIDDPSEVPNLTGDGLDLDGGVLIDELAVDLALDGYDVPLPRPERLIALVRLHRERWSDARIADALHVADRTVLRDRQELGLESWDYSDIRQVDTP